MNQAAPVNILHIKSSGHSGSTLLNILLAKNKGVFAGGHMFRYHRLWVKADVETTTSGTLLKDCNFWNDVKSRVTDKTLGDRASSPGYKYNKNDFEILFRAVLQSSGCQLICDNSKARDFDAIIYNPPFKSLMVHLVRDGRAVCHSVSKKERLTPLTPLRWVYSNLKIWLLNRHKDYYIFVSYEDLMNNTEETLERILQRSADFFQTDIESLKTEGQETVQYMFAGNRMRNTFDGEIKHDKAYLGKLSGFTWFWLSMIMSPALLVFKYPLSRQALKKDA